MMRSLRVSVMRAVAVGVPLVVAWWVAGHAGALAAEPEQPETKQMFEKSALLSMDADSALLTQYIAGEVKRWTAFVEEKGLKK